MNKLNTKAELRLHLPSTDWIEDDVKARLQAYQNNRINKEQELVITSQEFRTQSKNKDKCIEKLKEMIAEAVIEPKERKIYEGLSEQGKAKRRDDKRKRGAVKQNRSKNMKDWD